MLRIDWPVHQDRDLLSKRSYEIRRKPVATVYKGHGIRLALVGV